MPEQHILIDPNPDELAKFISIVNDKTKADGGKLGLLRFVVSKSGKVAFGDAMSHYHYGLRQCLIHDNDCLEGFVTGDRILEVRKHSAEDYFDKKNPAIEDIKASDFYRQYALIIKEVYFMPALLVS